MNFMKRSLTLMLAGLMAVSMVACGSGSTDSNASKDVTVDEDGREMVGNTYKTGLPIVKETETFKCWYGSSANDLGDDPNEKDIMKIINPETNVVIDWQCTSANIDEQLSLALATVQTMPDFVLAWPNDTTVTKSLKQLTPLTDMLEEWAPNIYSQTMENLADGIDNFKRADGEIYALPAGAYAEPTNSVVGVTFMNQSWLDNVGMELPTTTDELKAVLTAFRDKDANGNGDTKDENPFVFADVNWAAQVMSYAGPWGIAGNSSNDYNSYYLIKDGKFVPTVDTQAMRDFLIYMNDLANEKLVNSDAFTIDNAAFNTLVSTDTVGMYSAWSKPIEEWPYLPVLEAPGYEGQQVKQGEDGYRTANMNGFMITRACKNPEAVLRWWDELHRDSYTKVVAREGLPGENGLWIENEDGTYSVNQPTTLPTGIGTEVELNYTIAFEGAGPLLFAGENAAPVLGSGTSDSIRVEYMNYYFDYFLTDFLPLYVPDEEQTDILNDYKIELNEYLDTFVANAVVSGKGLDDAGWQAHVDTLYNDLDLQGWIDWNQKYYDGEFKN